MRLRALRTPATQLDFLGHPGFNAWEYLKRRETILSILRVLLINYDIHHFSSWTYTFKETLIWILTVSYILESMVTIIIFLINYIRYLPLY